MKSFFFTLFILAFGLASSSQTLNLYNVVGGGPFCQGTTGSRIWLDGSEIGKTYELVYNDTFSVISNLPGTGDSVYFGRYAVNGFYKVVAHDTILNLTDTMNGQVEINMVLLPSVFNITGGGSICENDNGPAIFLSGSQSNVLYDLFLNDTILVSTYSGNGSALFLGNFILDGVYSAVGRNTSLPTCPNEMNGNAVIRVYQPPVSLPLQGNGTFCPGSLGARLFLYPSELNRSYTLYNAANVPVGNATGNGDTLYFNPVSISSDYTAVGSRIEVAGCTTPMSGIVSVSPLNQTIYTVSGGGIACENSPGGIIILSGSQQGFNYYWRDGLQDTSSLPVSGTGGALVFDSLYLNGTFNIWSIHQSIPACLTSMAGSATIQLQSLPVEFSLIGGGYYCEGQEGVSIGLDGSEPGIQYEVKLNQNLATSLGGVGTGDSLQLGIASLSGIYSVEASVNGCRTVFSSTVEVSVTDCTGTNLVQDTLEEEAFYSIHNSTLSLKALSEQVEIVDGSGKMVYSGRAVQEVDLLTLGSGLFFVRASNNLPFKFVIP